MKLKKTQPHGRHALSSSTPWLFFCLLWTETEIDYKIYIFVNYNTLKSHFKPSVFKTYENRMPAWREHILDSEFLPRPSRKWLSRSLLGMFIAYYAACSISFRETPQSCRFCRIAYHGHCCWFSMLFSLALRSKSLSRERGAFKHTGSLVDLDISAANWLWKIGYAMAYQQLAVKWWGIW